ncbi:MAG: isoprenyl transferase [Oscillospiraceae bacterium]|nr:isoprenyl transferase [Oscillospiraceae bacterium]
MNTYGIDTERLPAHIAIIMDGNGRWAKKRGLPRSAGHLKGSDNVKRITHFVYDIGIKVLTLYAFSTENWKRPAEEVNALFDLFYKNLQDYRALMGNRDAVVRFIGDKTPFDDRLKEKMKEIEEYSKQFEDTGYVFNFAINYGGREEITASVKKIIQGIKNGEIKEEEINEQMISDNLYTSGLPDPDMIIRPSGEQRISNFLLWQSAYSEFFYSDILWPDYGPKQLAEAIKEFQKRNRRFGGI